MEPLPAYLGLTLVACLEEVGCTELKYGHCHHCTYIQNGNVIAASKLPSFMTDSLTSYDHERVEPNDPVPKEQHLAGVKVTRKC